MPMFRKDVSQIPAVTRFTDAFPYGRDIGGDDWLTALRIEVGIQPFAPSSSDVSIPAIPPVVPWCLAGGKRPREYSLESRR